MFSQERIDRITHEHVNEWHDALAPSRETIRARSYRLLRTTSRARPPSAALIY